MEYTTTQQIDTSSLEPNRSHRLATLEEVEEIAPTEEFCILPIDGECLAGAGINH